MAESAAPRDPLQRYAAIEQAYRDDRWPEVIRSGQELLGDLAAGPGPARPGLRERLELLMAHAHLYGLGNRDRAEELYRSVLRVGAEPALREIAEQGLQQCSLPAAGAEAGAAGTEDSRMWSLSDGEAATISGAGATGLAQPPSLSLGKERRPLVGDGQSPPARAGGGGTAAVGPLAGSPEAPLIPEVVEEPELIEVHQADPRRAEEVEVRLQSPQPSFGAGRPAPVAAGASVAAANAARASGGRTGAAMAQQSGMRSLHRRRRLQAGPFAAPPLAVAEEDTELLMGLLRLEMG
ncbi:MAG: hypothetical protein VKJ44_09810 [Synechococcus sp.]|nr:hypothetical protein [Synechococcus sp.]